MLQDRSGLTVGATTESISMTHTKKNIVLGDYMDKNTYYSGARSETLLKV